MIIKTYQHYDKKINNKKIFLFLFNILYMHLKKIEKKGNPK